MGLGKEFNKWIKCDCIIVKWVRIWKILISKAWKTFAANALIKYIK